MDDALDIALDPGGAVYVTGRATHNLFQITPSGAVSQILDASGDSAGNPLAEPRYVEGASDGSIYVSGAISDNVFRVAPPPVIDGVPALSGRGLAGLSALFVALAACAAWRIRRSGAATPDRRA